MHTEELRVVFSMSRNMALNPHPRFRQQLAHNDGRHTAEMLDGTIEVRA